MQQVATQFAGQQHSAADVRQAWQQMLGMGGQMQNPFADLFTMLQGPGVTQVDGWIKQIEPYLETFRGDASRWMHLPTFGPMREHQERWQALAQAQQDYQQEQGRYSALMMTTAQRALDLFQQQLEDRAEPGRQITTARGLFDAWIDAAEAAYAEIALSQEFRHVYGALTNAQMRLRQGIQKEVEHVCGLFGMPTRTEIDSAHRRITELERALRRNRAQQQPAATRARAAKPAAARSDGAEERHAAPVAEPTVAAAGRAIATPAKPLPARTARKAEAAGIAAVEEQLEAASAAAAPAAKPARKGAAAKRTRATAKKRGGNATKARKSPAKASKKSAVLKTAAPARRAAALASPPARKVAATKPSKAVAAKAATTKAATPKATTPKKAASKRIASKTTTPKSAAKPIRKPARKKSAPGGQSNTPSPAAAPPTGAVVSMKDWVMRNAAAQAAGASAPVAAPRRKGSSRR